MKEYKQEFFKGERALFQGQDLIIKDSIFDAGESPLKESRNIDRALYYGNKSVTAVRVE